MEHYTQFGLRGDTDEQFRRAARDGFKRAGLSATQLTAAMGWYRDHGHRLGGDQAKITESFSEFAAAKGWADQHRDAAMSVYGTIRDQGPAAIMAPTTAEADAATIARATELMRTDLAAYWRDAELQEAQYEALQRQGSATAPGEASMPAPATSALGAPPAPVATPQERNVDQQRHDEIVAMMRDPVGARDYRGSSAVQEEFRGVLGRLGGEGIAVGRLIRRSFRRAPERRLRAPSEFDHQRSHGR